MVVISIAVTRTAPEWRCQLLHWRDPFEPVSRTTRDDASASPGVGKSCGPPSVRTSRLPDQSIQPLPEIGGTGVLAVLPEGGQLCVPVGNGLMAIRVSSPGQ